MPNKLFPSHIFPFSLSHPSILSFSKSLALLVSIDLPPSPLSLPFFLPVAATEVPRNDTCPELPEITNGWKSTSHPELVHGTVVTYQCYPGYQLVGTELLMCQWDLTWSGDLPSCERGETLTCKHTRTQKYKTQHTCNHMTSAPSFSFDPFSIQAARLCLSKDWDWVTGVQILSLSNSDNNL